jgi:hypothetical protein
LGLSQKLVREYERFGVQIHRLSRKFLLLSQNAISPNKINDSGAVRVTLHYPVICPIF